VCLVLVAWCGCEGEKSRRSEEAASMNHVSARGGRGAKGDRLRACLLLNYSSPTRTE
jgi:hypothetical protein